MTKQSAYGNQDVPPFSRGIAVQDIPPGGVADRLALDQDERRSVADLLGVAGVAEFLFDYQLIPSGKGRYRLKGRLRASVTQECVLTLEPIEVRYDENLVIDLWPPKDVAMAEKFAGDEGRSILLDGPEPIVDEMIDVGQLAYEYLASELNPYPRKENAAFEWTDEDRDQDSETRKPMAHLGELLRRQSRGSE